MKKDLGVVPAVFPMPVLMIATYDENGVVDVMNAAWDMISDMDQITLFLGQDRKTVANMKVSKAHMKEADFFGIATGNKMPDKFARTGLTAVKSAHVNAPIIEEFPLVMECELDRFLDDGNFFAVIGKIVNTAADESVLDERGKVEPAKLNAILFDQFRNGYYAIGEKVGKAWNVGAGLMKE